MYDSADAAVTLFTGAEPLTAVLWPGDAKAPAATLAASWSDAAAGQVVLTIAAASIAALAPQPYPVLVTCVGGDGLTRELWRGWLDVLAGPGSAAAVPVYGSFADMLTYCGGWIRQLLTPDSTDGFLAERGRRPDVSRRDHPRPLAAVQRGDAARPALGRGLVHRAQAPDPWLMGELADGSS